jgi:hypothetical protein
LTCVSRCLWLMCLRTGNYHQSKTWEHFTDFIWSRWSVPAAQYSMRTLLHYTTVPPLLQTSQLHNTRQLLVPLMPEQVTFSQYSPKLSVPWWLAAIKFCINTCLAPKFLYIPHPPSQINLVYKPSSNHRLFFSAAHDEMSTELYRCQRFKPWSLGLLCAILLQTVQICKPASCPQQAAKPCSCSSTCKNNLQCM